MVLVSLINRVDPVQHHSFPFLPVTWHDQAHVIVQPPHVRIPGAVGFQIVFVDQIQAVAVAQAVNPGIIGIMAGTDGVDIVPLHSQDI